MTGQSWNEQRIAELLELQITAISLDLPDPMHVVVAAGGMVRIRISTPASTTTADVSVMEVQRNAVIIRPSDAPKPKEGEEAFIVDVARFFRRLLHGAYLVSWNPLGLSKLGSETRVTVENMEQGLLKLLG